MEQRALTLILRRSAKANRVRFDAVADMVSQVTGYRSDQRRGLDERRFKFDAASKLEVENGDFENREYSITASV